jgi:hypothetical protein
LARPLALAAWHFPYATDDPVRHEDAVRESYEIAFSEPSVVRKGDQSDRERRAVQLRANIRAEVRHFVQQYHLQSAAVLDVGSGDGYLQDHVANYTGLDISAAAAKNYRKRFVHGTATAMPFADDHRPMGHSGGVTNVKMGIWRSSSLPISRTPGAYE